MSRGGPADTRQAQARLGELGPLGAGLGGSKSPQEGAACTGHRLCSTPRTPQTIAGPDLAFQVPNGLSGQAHCTQRRATNLTPNR